MSHLLGVSTSTVRAYARDGRLDVVEVGPGGRRRYSRRQVEALARGAAVSEPDHEDEPLASLAELRDARRAATRLAQAKAMSEDELLAKVRALATAFRLLSYHTHRSTHSEPGFPDLVVVGRASVLWVELKKHTGKTTAPQEVWLGRLRRAGERVELWRPLDLLEGTIEATLRGMA